MPQSMRYLLVRSSSSCIALPSRSTGRHGALRVYSKASLLDQSSGPGAPVALRSAANERANASKSWRVDATKRSANVALGLVDGSRYVTTSRSAGSDEPMVSFDWNGQK
eukprot:Amastigsp_a339352_5.p4 type:complete len:109 gc:universal Amastigsp_a339352_5:1210-884(-)